MSSTQKIVLIGGLLIGIFIVQTVFLLRYIDKKAKTGYILTQQVFEGFDGTKQIKLKLKNQSSRQKNIIDSLAVEYKLIAVSTDAKSKMKAAQLKQLYGSLYSKYQEDNEAEVEKYNAEIWKQINQYLKEYGKDNNYSVLYGADGTGALMYADTTLNVSTKVISYINKKYAGQ